MKKALSFILSLCIVFSMAVAACAVDSSEQKYPDAHKIVLESAENATEAIPTQRHSTVSRSANTTIPGMLTQALRTMK